jgi:hypothetical protein
VSIIVQYQQTDQQVRRILSPCQPARTELGKYQIKPNFAWCIRTNPFSFFFGGEKKNCTVAANIVNDLATTLTAGSPTLHELQGPHNPIGREELLP